MCIQKFFIASLYFFCMQSMVCNSVESEKKEQKQVQAESFFTRPLVVGILTRLRIMSPSMTQKELTEIKKQRLLRENDLRGQNFDGLDLRGEDLRDKNFDNCSLKKALFDGANLRKASFEDADLSGASLVDVHIEGAWMVHTNFKNTDFAPHTPVPVMAGGGSPFFDGVCFAGSTIAQDFIKMAQETGSNSFTFAECKRRGFPVSDYEIEQEQLAEKVAIEKEKPIGFLERISLNLKEAIKNSAKKQ